MEKILEVGDKEIKVEVTAFTMLVYEDAFKGRSLLRDVDMLTSSKSNKVQFSTAVRVLWAAAKSADESTKPIKEFAKQFSFADVISAAGSVVNLVIESLKTSSKKATAAAV